MNERIRELAEQATEKWVGGEFFDRKKFAELVRADEREACAKVCDGIMQYYKTNTTMNTDQNLIGYMAAELCGVRIRERGEK